MALPLKEQELVHVSDEVLKLDLSKISLARRDLADEGLSGSAQVAPTGSAYMLTYYGGPVMVKPMNLYVICKSRNLSFSSQLTSFAFFTVSQYGNWNGYEDEMENFHHFLDNISTGSWWKLMEQYKNPPTARFKGSAVIPKTSPTLDEAQMRPLIGNLLDQDIFPVDADAMYIFIAGFDTEPNQMTTSGQKYCTVFCGFHSDFASNSTGFTDIKFGVSGMTCPYCGDANPWISLQLTVSHEIAEVITDPLVNQASYVGPPVAWYNEKYGEVGDIWAFTAAMIDALNSPQAWNISVQSTRSARPDRAGNYRIPPLLISDFQEQKIWSNKDQRCMP
ncbi:hypothetical protein HDU78_003433 [Chytriomyces hyalinus]|nr:hypothetical protein HDU78_003433 [Chytriomyces hyalinus]